MGRAGEHLDQLGRHRSWFHLIAIPHDACACTDRAVDMDMLMPKRLWCICVHMRQAHGMGMRMHMRMHMHMHFPIAAPSPSFRCGAQWTCAPSTRSLRRASLTASSLAIRTEAELASGEEGALAPLPPHHHVGRPAAQASGGRAVDRARRAGSKRGANTPAKPPSTAPPAPTSSVLAPLGTGANKSNEQSKLTLRSTSTASVEAQSKSAFERHRNVHRLPLAIDAFYGKGES